MDKIRISERYWRYLNENQNQTFLKGGVPLFYDSSEWHILGLFWLTEDPFFGIQPVIFIFWISMTERERHTFLGQENHCTGIE